MDARRRLFHWYELSLRNSKIHAHGIHNKSDDKSIINKRYSNYATYKQGFKGLRHNRLMAIDQLKAFLAELQTNKELLNAIGKASTANEIAEMASVFGYEFSGDELKAISKENIPGMKIKKQDTSPSYSFGESGIDPNEKNYR